VKKTLFSVFLPAAEKYYELWVPDELSVYEAKSLIANLLKEHVGRHFEAGSTAALYDMATGVELDINVRVQDLGFVNGAKLMLV
jgi:hypothetical protein